MDYLEVCCSISQCLEYFVLSFNFFYIWFGYLTFLRFVLWPRIFDECSVRLLEKSVYPTVIGWSLYMYVPDTVRWWCFSDFLYLLISCLIFLSTAEKGVLKSCSLILELSLPPLSSVNVHFMYFKALLFGAYTFRIAMSSWCNNPFIIMLSFCSSKIFCFEVYFIWY